MAKIKKIKVPGTENIYSIEYVGFERDTIDFRAIFLKLAEAEIEDDVEKMPHAEVVLRKEKSQYHDVKK